jgi:antitoxin ParD1/3/4
METPPDAPITSNDNEPIWPTRAQSAFGKNQVEALQEQARAGGLQFEAYLPPSLVEWVLDLIRWGQFHDPSEAVFVMLTEMQDLYEHPDLRQELLKRTLNRAADGPHPGIPAEEVFAKLKARMVKPLPKPATWQKMPPEVAPK